MTKIIVIKAFQVPQLRSDTIFSVICVLKLSIISTCGVGGMLINLSNPADFGTQGADRMEIPFNVRDIFLSSRIVKGICG